MPKITLQEAIKSRPDLPVIVIVDNYELAYDYDTTAQGIRKAEVGTIVSWNERVYCYEDEFIEDYCALNWQVADEKKLEAKAHELWEKHAKECIVCYSHAAAMPEGCEIQ